MKVKYIDDRIANGMEYDWGLIEKEYARLKCPPEFYQIPFRALPSNKYFIGMSDRSTGKTTQWLLWGLVMGKLYGVVVQYIRATEDELAPSHAAKLVDTIKSYDGGRYIDTLTDGRWNSIYYHWRQYFYCNVDADGNRVEVSEAPIIQCLSVEKSFDYKSSYNAPMGDIIIFDEFIGKYYRPDEAIRFFDLTKTIFRERISGFIVMLANDINLSSPYFEEFEISKEVRRMERGEKKQFITEKGTHLYIEIIDAAVTRSKERQRMNALFYGFKNPKLNAITGAGRYAYDSVPHIISHSAEWRCIENRLYIDTGVDLLHLIICWSPEDETHIEVTRATRTYDDSYILTLTDEHDKRHLWGFGTPKIRGVIGKLMEAHKIFFQSNEIGTIYNDYLKRYLALKR